MAGLGTGGNGPQLAYHVSSLKTRRLERPRRFEGSPQLTWTKRVLAGSSGLQTRDSGTSSSNSSVSCQIGFSILVPKWHHHRSNAAVFVLVQCPRMAVFPLSSSIAPRRSLLCVKVSRGEMC